MYVVPDVDESVGCLKENYVLVERKYHFQSSLGQSEAIYACHGCNASITHSDEL